MELISRPFGYFLEWLSNLLGGNFALSVFVFTLAINLVLLPLTIKSQKSTSKQARLKPKLDALKKKYGDDKQKYSQAMQELYSRENVTMAGGCLPMIIRMVIIFAVYYVISDPLQYLLRFSATEVNSIKDALVDSGFLANAAKTRNVDLIKFITDGTINNIGIDPAFAQRLVDAVRTIDFNFLGIDLSQTPTFSLNFKEMFANNLWIIPIASFISNILNSVVSMRLQKISNPEAPSMAAMMLLMPVVSLWITFTVPCALGFYWTLSSLVAGGLQVFTTYMYSPAKLIAAEQAKETIKAAKIEAAKIAKAETSSTEE